VVTGPTAHFITLGGLHKSCPELVEWGDWKLPEGDPQSASI
jgi:hypothetical protein